MDNRYVETDRYNALKLDNQLCFPLYACSKEIVRRYKPFLDELGITYTQYITLMVLWEEKNVNVKELGSRLFLDSGTLTPVLKRLEQKGLISRQRDSRDERNLIVSITNEGEALKERAVEVPYKMAGCVKLDRDDAGELYRILKLLLQKFGE
ncbi:MAG: MarR family transcriptional regulator [Clostridia bacterium]|nr:MarR family transcriptional regulator [Clostridia bacterium]